MSGRIVRSSERVSRKARQVAAHLRARVRERGSDCYVKSKDIAEDVDLSPQEIGACMRELRECGDPDLSVEKWAYSNATTWRVALE